MVAAQLPDGRQPVQRSVSPADSAGCRTDIVISWRDGEFQWSARVDGWDWVVAGGWHTLDSLRALAALPADTGPVDVTDDLTLTPRPGGEVDVTVRAADGRTATARDVLISLTSAAGTFLDRAADERLRGATFWSC